MRRGPQGLAGRLAWFVGLWVLGVGVLAAVGLLIKLMLGS